MNIEELILKYAVMMPVRFSIKQKYLFINEIAKEYKALGYEVNAVMNQKGKKAVNLMIGDLKNAETIIVSHYDTPQKNYGKTLKYFPISGTNSFVSTFISVYTPLIFGGFLSLYLLLFQVPNIDFENNLLGSVVVFGLLLVLLAGTSVMTKGVANKYNYNRNSSGVIGSLLLAEKLKGKKKVAFVLTDMGCMNHKGDQMLQEALPKTLKDKTVLVLDCIAKGARVGVGYRSAAKTAAHKFIKLFDEDKLYSKEMSDEDLKYHTAQYYEKAIIVSYGKKQGDSFFVEDTASNQDNEIDNQVVLNIVDKIATFIK